MNECACVVWHVYEWACVCMFDVHNLFCFIDLGKKCPIIEDYPQGKFCLDSEIKFAKKRKMISPFSHTCFTTKFELKKPSFKLEFWF